MTNAATGAYYKGRTKQWAEARGFTVADLEIVRWIHTAGGRRIPVKRDQLASDLLLVRGDQVIFVQVKGGAQARGLGKFLDAQRAFKAFVFPSFTSCWIVAWAPRASSPRIIVVHPQELHGQEETVRPVRTVRPGTRERIRARAEQRRAALASAAALGAPAAAGDGTGA